jgi:hypothetical protein
MIRRWLHRLLLPPHWYQRHTRSGEKAQTLRRLAEVCGGRN